MSAGPCMAPNCPHAGELVLVVSGQRVVLCAEHVAAVRASAQDAAVHVVQGVEKLVPGFAAFALRAVHVVRALREPLPSSKPEPIVVEAKVVT